MDYLEITFGQNKYKYYGKIGDFYIARNYDIVENPGGNFLPIYKGNYTQPIEVDFELFVSVLDTYFYTFAGIGNRYYAEISLERFNSAFTVYIYNLIITSKEKMIIYKTPNAQQLPTGEYHLYKGKLTAYFMVSMS